MEISWVGYVTKFLICVAGSVTKFLTISGVQKASSGGDSAGKTPLWPAAALSERCALKPDTGGGSYEYSMGTALVNTGGKFLKYNNVKYITYIRATFNFTRFIRLRCSTTVYMISPMCL